MNVKLDGLNDLPQCEDTILHRWMEISDFELHRYIDRFLIDFFMNQVKKYINQIADLPRDDDGHMMKVLTAKKETFERVADSLCKISKKKCHD